MFLPYIGAVQRKHLVLGDFLFFQSTAILFLDPAPPAGLPAPTCCPDCYDRLRPDYPSRVSGTIYCCVQVSLLNLFKGTDYLHQI